MKMQMYTVFDKVAGEYGPPWVAKNEAVAQRQFEMLVRADQIANSDDYTLYELGEYNTDSAHITLHVAPTLIPVIIGGRHE